MRSGTWLSGSRTGAVAMLAALGLALAATPAQAKKVLSNVYGFGSDGQGELGAGTTKGFKPRTTPTPLPGIGGVSQIARSGNSGFAVLDDGRLLAWGRNEHGALGIGSTMGTASAVPVTGVSGVTAAAAGEATLALRADGTVEAWGANSEGEVGDGTTEDKHSPVPVTGLSEAVAVAAHGVHSLALLSDGSVVEWGRSYTAFSSNTSPVAVPGISGAVAVAAGNDFGLALLADGEVLAWGSTLFGQLGNGEKDVENRAPQRVCAVGTAGTCPEGPYLTGATAIAASDGFALARLEDGTVASWGSNASGDLGIGETVGPEQCGGTPCSDTPRAVSGLSGVLSVAAGEEYGLALLAGGTLEAWGFDGYGQLGNGSTKSTSAPAAVPGLTGIVGLAAGGTDSYAFGAQQPVMIKSKPHTGAAGTTVTIEGVNMLTATSVQFGATPATSVTVLSPTKVAATVPALEPGTYVLTVTNPSGTSAPTAKGTFKVR